MARHDYIVKWHFPFYIRGSTRYNSRGVTVAISLLMSTTPRHRNAPLQTLSDRYAPENQMGMNSEVTFEEFY